MIRPLQAIAAALALALCAGCATSPASPKPAYTLRRHLNVWETTLPVPIEKVHKATVAGLADLGLRPSTNSVDKLSGLTDGMMADGTPYEVRLQSVDETHTLVRVRSGVLGDRVRSAQLFRAIEARL